MAWGALASSRVPLGFRIRDDTVRDVEFDSVIIPFKVNVRWGWVKVEDLGPQILAYS